MSQTQNIIETGAPKATYMLAGVLAGLGAWSLKDWAVAVSIVLAVATYATNLFFKLRSDRRDQKRLDLAEERHNEDTQ